MDRKKVVWSEGMFLCPQHFQQQERYLEDYARRYLEQLQPGRCGLSDLALDEHLLAIGKVGVRQASGLFPDGTPFHLRTAVAVEVPEDTRDKMVYLALPVYKTGSVEVGDNTSDNRRYHLISYQAFDACRDDSDSIQLDVAELNIRLKLEGEDIQDLTVIPVARVHERKPDGVVELNKAFIPMCLHFGVSEYLVDHVSDLYTQMLSRARDISHRIRADKSNKSPQALMEDHLWLQTLSRWLPLLQSWLNDRRVHPEELYRWLLVIQGDFFALGGRLQDEPDNFQVNRLYILFSGLFATLRTQLQQVRVDAVVQLPWDDSLLIRRRLLRTSIQDRSLYSASRFILAVTASMGTQEISRQFPLLCKLGGNSRIAELVRNALSGIPLQVLPVPPVELKVKTDAAYFELDTRSPLWLEMLQKEESLALHMDEQLGDVAVELFAIR